MNIEQRKIELKRVLVAAQEELAEIESVESRAANIIQVGKYFKYRNNYSCPQSPADYWWLYTKIIALDEQFSGFRAFRFQLDKNGQLTVEYDTYLHAGLLNAGYVEISRAEFANAYEQVLADLKSVRY